MRTNGWEAPFHYLQVITWVFFPTMMAMFFAFYTPLLEVSAAYIGTIAYAVLCVVVVYSVIRCTGTNPADDSVLRQETPTEVGDDQVYCHVCVKYVHKDSRHCRLCDKCISVFDHHCKWLNNCVGKKNYQFFLTCVVSATLMLGLQVALGAFLLWSSYSDDKDVILKRSASAFGCSSSRDDATGLCVDDGYRVSITVVKVIHMVLLALASPMCFLIAQLTLFHFQLCIENITTYDYIVRKRKRKLQRERDIAVRAPWWKLLYARLCCQRLAPVDEPNKETADKSHRASRVSGNSETEEQAAIEAEVDEDLEVLSARSGDVGDRRGSLQIGKSATTQNGVSRGFGLHVTFNSDGSLMSSNSTTIDMAQTPVRGTETNYIGAPLTPRSPRSDPSSAYHSEISETSVVMMGRASDRSANHVV